MLFNSIEFALFLPLVFAVYWALPARYTLWRNLWLLLASCVFYGAWDYKFLALLLGTCALDFMVGLLLAKYQNPLIRRALVWLSIGVNLGILCTFKYYNFFIDSLLSLFQTVGIFLHPKTIQLILPVGVSFYTFQALSYTLDVFHRKIEPTRNWVTFFAYVTFFPQLVAGPIERAHHFLPQFSKQHAFDYSQIREGLRYILWGMFKKIVIADTCGTFADEIFGDYATYNSSALLLGAVFFSFQIYGDFSGYSDIAVGTGKLFGFNLMRNFDYPYFAKNIAEFWRKWHISLTTWFRDYLYIPLGGSRGTRWQTIRNIMIVFLVSGLWHGANWTFVFWGFLNAMYFLPLFLTNQYKPTLIDDNANTYLPSFKAFLQIGITFSLTTLAWVFFRSNNLSAAFAYLQQLFSLSNDGTSLSTDALFQIVWIVVLVVWEWMMRHQAHGLALERLPMPVRWGIYLLLVWLILYFFGEEQKFIYFQF